MREIVASKLIRDGFLVETVGDGVAATAAITSPEIADFDLVCSDLNMPNLDGIAFLSRLAESGFKGAVIILSGENDAIRRTAETYAAESGLNVLGSLSKPFDPTRFDQLLLAAKSRIDHEIEDTPEDDISPDLLFAEDGGAIPYFQPQVCVRTGAVVGAEALVRLPLADGTIATPARILPIVGEHGLHSRLFFRMVEASINELTVWQKAGYAPDVSVNIDPGTLTDVSLPDRLRELATAARVDPMKIVIEITENAAISAAPEVLQVIARLRMYGFGISIDDFGMGHSNFERLRRLPFTELKIDRQFVVDAPTDQLAAACVTSSVALARAAGFVVVAEGVERKSQLDHVKRAGVDRIQGFLISKPLPAEMFRRYLDYSARALAG
ncbi:MAG: EAL domain-containing protein [Hyphomicrobiales bacterium]|nr:EAL domain-containing protein [Hyphomicrobiales bacterium]